MMKSFGIAQTPGLDSLRHELAIATHDTSRVLILAKLCGGYKLIRPDSAFFYGSKALALARKIKFPKGEVATMRHLSVTHIAIGNDSKALQITLQALKIAEKHNFIDYKALLTGYLGGIYFNSGNYTRALSLLRESKVLFDSMQYFNASVRTLSEIGKTFLAFWTVLHEAPSNEISRKNKIICFAVVT